LSARHRCSASVRLAPKERQHVARGEGKASLSEPDRNPGLGLVLARRPSKPRELAARSWRIAARPHQLAAVRQSARPALIARCRAPLARPVFLAEACIVDQALPARAGLQPFVGPTTLSLGGRRAGVSEYVRKCPIFSVFSREFRSYLVALQHFERRTTRSGCVTTLAGRRRCPKMFQNVPSPTPRFGVTTFAITLCAARPTSRGTSPPAVRFRPSASNSRPHFLTVRPYRTFHPRQRATRSPPNHELPSTGAAASPIVYIILFVSIYEIRRRGDFIAGRHPALRREFDFRLAKARPRLP
jgi:hypothetical protein